MTRRLRPFFRDYLEAFALDHAGEQRLNQVLWQRDLEDIFLEHYARVIATFRGVDLGEKPLEAVVIVPEQADRLLAKAEFESVVIFDTIQRDIAEARLRHEQKQRFGRARGLSIGFVSSMRESGRRLFNRIPLFSGMATQDVAEETRQYTVVEEGGEGLTKTWITMLDHKVRTAHRFAHGQQQLVEDPFLVKGQQLRFPGDQALGASLDNVINCFPADTDVSGNIRGATRHWYEGPLVEIVTASGKTLAGTLNHPVLTAEGWVGLGSLEKGSHVVCRRLADRSDRLASELAGAEAGRLDVDHIEPAIAQVFDALAQSGRRERVLAGDVDFHGDRPAHDVDIVRADGVLRLGRNASGIQHADHLRFARSGFDARLLLPARLACQFLVRGLGATALAIGGLSECLALLWKRVGHAQEHAFAAGPGHQANVFECSNDGRTADAELLGDRLDRLAILKHGNGLFAQGFALLSSPFARLFPRVAQHASFFQPGVNRHCADADVLGDLRNAHGPVQFDPVIDIRVLEFAGHVYNLETVEGHYTAQGIVVHNCRCVARYSRISGDEPIAETPRLVPVRPRRPGERVGPRLPGRNRNQNRNR